MENSKIQWTGSTVNFWSGCTKVSAGCKNCYMHRIKEQKGQNPDIVYRASDTRFYEALNWEVGRKIFTCSMSDFFIEEADGWREEAWDVIRKTPQHTWQILTKRPERVLDCLPADWGEGWNNVWLGITIENQDCMHRATTLGNVPAFIKFISAEPLLGELDLSIDEHGKAFLEKFHWCIIGGESGNEKGKYRYRECKQEWIEKLITDTKGSQVKIFVKQMGTHLGKKMNMSGFHGDNIWKFPDHLKIREYPDATGKLKACA